MLTTGRGAPGEKFLSFSNHQNLDVTAMNSGASHRIDSPEKPSPAMSRPSVHVRIAAPTASNASLSTPSFRLDAPAGVVNDSPAGDEISADSDAWLRMHATDLVDHLQAWSADLDARESQINLRASMQDHRERQFRLMQQDAAAELAERQRAIDRLRSEIQAQARRLAFGS